VVDNLGPVKPVWDAGSTPFAFLAGGYKGASDGVRDIVNQTVSSPVQLAQCAASEQCRNSLTNGASNALQHPDQAFAAVRSAAQGTLKQVWDNFNAKVKAGDAYGAGSEAGHAGVGIALIVTSVIAVPAAARAGLKLLTNLLGRSRAVTTMAEATEAAGVEANVRPRNIKFGDPGDGVMGSTDPVTGKITIRSGLSGVELDQTIIHEAVHARVSGIFNKVGLGPADRFLYNNSQAWRWAHEALAEGVATGSVRTGIRFPFTGYGISPGGLLREVGTVGATGAGAIWVLSHRQ
jgi:hypothetical protein